MTRTVLVVEDDVLIAELMRMQLEGEGFEVKAVHDGPSALAAVRDESPDVVLLDVMMPEMDGWSVLEQLRSDDSTAALPVIMVTSRSMPADEIRSRNLGATDYLVKPYDVDVLVHKVRHTLGEPDAG
jgi:DNA-binding response OmpR family regulator